MIYAIPGGVFETTFNVGTTGLVGDAGAQIVDGQGTVVSARSTAGILETPAASGIYTVTRTAPLDHGQYSVVFDDDDGTFLNDDLTVNGSGAPEVVPSLAGHYTSPEALRTTLNVTEVVLSDAAATELILQSEDLIDEMLGAWPIDDTSGRKIVEDDVEAWQFAKLQRATNLLAAAIYRDPDMATRAQFKSQSGPDFSFSGRIGGEVSTVVLLPLNQSGLRRLGGRVGPGRSSRYDRFFDARRHDGT